MISAIGMFLIAVPHFAGRGKSHQIGNIRTTYSSLINIVPAANKTINLNHKLGRQNQSQINNNKLSKKPSTLTSQAERGDFEIREEYQRGRKVK